ncbi:WG repeat-containing protein [Burkholderia ubonensis]|uniref:WG repeat-containing protein n=1 Tax=Burkholderia ubonensis TaxID=101571 RepID=UPI00016A3EB4|nr:WG repeat-containing protein [Burkholderia ubonensis]
MAHRLYLYNLDDVGRTSAPCLGMVEWNYDFPTVLSPLLSSSPFLARSRCNDTGDADGLYADAAGGKALMARLYAFLERHAERLIDDPDAFREAKRKILAFLGNRAVHRYFHLDAWDVFNLSDETHAGQAQALLARIERDNARIRAAIDADDPALLDACEGLACEDATSFRELINQPHYDYGWEPLTSIIYDEALVFEQDGRQGVMAVTGEVLAPARYDEIGEFDAWTDVAIVRQGDRYGHLDTTGREITPVRYEQVWAFWHGEFARVRRHGKFGVVDRHGVEVVPCRYAELTVLRHFGECCWAARAQALWGVVDPRGQWRLPAEFDAIDHSTGVIFATPAGRTVPDVYTRRLVRLGSAPPTRARRSRAITGSNASSCCITTAPGGWPASAPSAATATPTNARRRRRPAAFACATTCTAGWRRRAPTCATAAPAIRPGSSTCMTPTAACCA